MIARVSAAFNVPFVRCTCATGNGRSVPHVTSFDAVCLLCQKTTVSRSMATLRRRNTNRYVSNVRQRICDVEDIASVWNAINTKVHAYVERYL